MKILRVCVIMLFAVMVGLYAYTVWQYRSSLDLTYPELSFPNDIIEVEMSDGDDVLLADVQAHDGKDGDISGKVVVESVSRFVEPGVCEITYAVCDSDNHVAKATRKIKYIDYKSPYFTMSNDLVFSLSENLDILDSIGAYDYIDGDISDRVTLTSDSYEAGKLGSFRVTASVTNTKGETISMTVPVSVENRSSYAPKISLITYLVYTDIGDSIDPVAYLVSATDSSGRDIVSSVTYESGVDITSPGVYSIDYYALDSSAREGHTVLTVIVAGTEAAETEAR